MDGPGVGGGWRQSIQRPLTGSRATRRAISSTCSTVRTGARRPCTAWLSNRRTSAEVGICSAAARRRSWLSRSLVMRSESGTSSAAALSAASISRPQPPHRRTPHGWLGPRRRSSRRWSWQALPFVLAEIGSAALPRRRARAGGPGGDHGDDEPCTRREADDPDRAGAAPRIRIAHDPAGIGSRLERPLRLDVGRTGIPVGSVPAVLGVCRCTQDKPASL